LAGSQTIDITGTIADSTTQKELPYGTVTIKSKTDSIIKGALTDENGEFKLMNIAYKNGMYVLIKYIGYAEKRIEITYSGNSKINLNKILLHPNASEMKEATVIGKTSYMEQKFDRKVFNIDDTKANSAKDIFDLLRTLPGVTVDEEDNVIYKGAPATIYVDDQPADYVYPKIEMIPVASILKIELIDASINSGEGKGGIINIKMKDFATDGFSGVAQADNRTISFKELNRSRDYFNINYKVKKVIFFDNSNYYHNYYKSSSTTNGTLNYNTSNYLLNNNASNVDIDNAFWNSGGIRYSPDENTRIRLSAGFYTDKETTPSKNNTQQNNTNPGSVFEEYSTISANDEHYFNKWLNASFYRKFDSLGKELSIYGGLRDQETNEITQNTYNYQYISNISSDSSFNYKTDEDVARISFYGGLSYNHPINKKTLWNCGWTGYIQYKGHDNTLYSQNDIVYYPLTKYTNNVFQEQSVYARIGTTVKKWKFDGGVTGQFDKYVDQFKRYNINSVDTLLNINKYFTYLFPSATIVFSADSAEEIKFTYSKNVQSFWFNQLCNFIGKSNPYNWSVGNSALVPTAYNNLYLGYLYHKETWNFNTDVFYSITNNDVSNLTIPVSDIITITKPENVAHNSSLGVELSSWVSIYKKFDLNLSSSINQTYISSVDYYGIESKEKNFGYSFKFNTNIHISDKTTGTFYMNYFSRVITFEGYNYNYINSSISLTQKLLNKKLLLTIGVNNIFNNLAKRGRYYSYAGIQENTSQYSDMYVPTYFITLQYKFKQGDRETKEQAGEESK
jgi:hypothetical protein